MAETGWYSPPNFRGTWDLIISCVLTLSICVWSALHLNVFVGSSRRKDRNIRRLRWIVIGIFAPEVVVSTAFAQFLTARWLMHEIGKDVEYRRPKVQNPYLLSLKSSFFLVKLSGVLSLQQLTCTSPMQTQCLKRITVTAGQWLNATLLLWAVSQSRRTTASNLKHH